MLKSLLNIKILLFNLIIIANSTQVISQWEQVKPASEVGFISYFYQYKDDIIGLSVNKDAYLIQDDGLTWQNITDNLGDTLIDEPIKTIGIHKNEIIAGTYNYGLFYSSDNGQTWYKKGNHFNRDTFIVKINSNGNLLIAGALPASVFISTNDGNSWSKIGDEFLYLHPYGYYENILRIGKVGFFKNSIFIAGYKGFFFTTDKGKNWTKSELYDTYFDTVDIDFMNIAIKGDTIFAATYTDGVMYSVDNGRKWLSCDIQTYDGYKLVVSDIYIKENLLFAASSHGLLVSNDNGNSWYYLNADLSLQNSSCVIVNNGFIYISAGSYLSNPKTGVYKARLSELLATTIERSDYFAHKLNITPNPATDYIDVMLNEVKHPFLNVKVYDVLGNIVLTLPCHSCGSRNLGEQGEIPHQVRNDNSIRIDVSGLAAGVYFVRVGGRMYKFVKM